MIDKKNVSIVFTDFLLDGLGWCNIEINNTEDKPFIIIKDRTGNFLTGISLIEPKYIDNYNMRLTPNQCKELDSYMLYKYNNINNWEKILEYWYLWNNKVLSCIPFKPDYNELEKYYNEGQTIFYEYFPNNHRQEYIYVLHGLYLTNIGYCNIKISAFDKEPICYIYTDNEIFICPISLYGKYIDTKRFTRLSNHQVEELNIFMNNLYSGHNIWKELITRYMSLNIYDYDYDDIIWEQPDFTELNKGEKDNE